MRKFEKRISINSLDKVAKENFGNISTQVWHDLEIEVRKSLELTDMLEFVHNVVESCFGESGDFIPEIMDFAIKSNILTWYANLTMPESLEHQYDLIYGTDIVETICRHISMEQLHEIVSAINRKVDYLCSAKTSVLQQKLGELVSAFENMRTKTEDVFANISGEDVNKLISAITERGISEEKLVEAYMKKMETKSPDEAVAQ